MRTPRTLPCLFPAATLLGLILIAGTVQAQVTNIIYQDSFARVGPLNGSAPDTVNVPGATWLAANNPAINAQIRTDGAGIALTNVPGTTNGVYLNAFLPFTPQVGHIYVLSCKIQALSGGNQNLAMGFAVQPLTNNNLTVVSCGAGLNLVRGNGTGVQPYRFPGGSGNIALRIAAFGTTTNLLTVVLDATTGTGNARGWTYRMYTNSVQVDSFAPANVAPTMIQYVCIGADSAQGNFQNFTLIDVLVRSNAPVLVEEPQNATAQVGQTATFWVGVTNDYPASAYQWATISGGVTNAIPGATNAFYTTPTLDMSYNGLNYAVSITNVYGSTNSTAGTLTVVSGGPTVYSATKTTNLTKIVVAFSKAVDPVTALNTNNYTLNLNPAPSGISIVSASYGAVSNSVILTTSSVLDTNAGYYLKVQNVQDLYGNAMTTSTNGVLPASLVFYVRADSGLVLDANNTVVQWLDQTTNGNNAAQYFGIPSVALSGPAARPGTNTINNDQLSVDFGNPGSTIPGDLHFLQAPHTASLASMVSNTTMYAVASFVSTAGNEFLNKTWGNLPAPFDWDPSAGENVQLGNGFNNAPCGGIGGTILVGLPYVLSSFIQLPTAGGTTNFQFYLNGANNGNGVNRSVTGNPPGIYDGGQPLWIGGRMDLQAANPKMRGQIATIMLFNTSLSDADRATVDNYLGLKYFQFAITTNLPASTTSTNGFSLTYTFSAGQGSAHGFSLQWIENGTNIPGAISNSYTTPILAPGDNGDTFVVQVTMPDGSFVYSATNTLTVLASPPVVTLAGIPIWNTNQIVVIFDHAVNPVTATTAGNYSLNNGANVLSAAMGDAPNKVVLSTSPLTWGPGFYSLTVQNVQDLYGNTLVTASTPVGLYPNAVLWLRANTGVTTDAGTNTVNLWTDLSGNNNNILGGGGPAIQPVLVTNTLGDPVVRFNQTDLVTNYMIANHSSSLAIVGDMSIIAAINPRTLASGRNGHVIAKTGPSPRQNIPAPYDYNVTATGAGQLLRGNGNGTVNGINFGSFAATNGTSVGYPFIVGVSETGNTISHYLNGQPAGTGVLSGSFAESNDFDNGNPAYIGARADGFNRLAGDLAELIVASSPMSSGDMAALANYISAQHRFVPFNPTRTNIVLSVTNHQIALSWPADHTGWQLQSNSLGLTVPDAWFPVPGSTATNQIIITPIPTNGSVLYRMYFQQP